MIRVEVNAIIERSIGRVFDRLTNLSGYAQWLPKSRVFLETKQTSEGPVGRGTTFIDKTRIGKFRGEVTDFQRPTKVSFRMRLRWLGINVMESRSVSGGTKVHLLAEGEMYGVFKLMKPYVAMRAREERKRTIEALKKSLESSSH